MKIFYTILFFLGFVFPLFAQDEANAEDLKNLESLKIGLITKRLKLSPEQAKGFWVLYDEFSKEREEVRKEQTKMALNEETKTDEVLKKDLENYLSLKEKEIGIERKYVNKFLNVITIKQLVKLYKAEAHFRRMLLETLRQRRKEGAPQDKSKRPNWDW